MKWKVSRKGEKKGEREEEGLITGMVGRKGEKKGEKGGGGRADKMEGK